MSRSHAAVAGQEFVSRPWEIPSILSPDSPGLRRRRGASLLFAVAFLAAGSAAPAASGEPGAWPRMAHSPAPGGDSGPSRPSLPAANYQSHPSLPDGATLDDYLRYAMQNSPVLEAAFYRWRAAAERVPQARSLPDPQLGFAVVLDQVDRDTEYMGERYSISQMFPWFGTLSLRGDIALENAEAEARRFEAARLELVDRVTRVYVEYAWLHQAAATARENRDLLIRLEAVVRSLYRTGTVSQADVNRAQVELGRLDDQVRSLEDMLGPAAAELNAALGRPAHARLPDAPPAPSREVLPELPDRDDEAWLALARKGNPALAASRHEVSRERQSIELARKEYFPNFMLGLEYARDGSARMARMDGGGADMVAGMISFNVPIGRARLDAGVREARARHNAATRDVQDREISLEAELKGALFAYRDSARRMTLYGGTLVPKARQSMATTESAYRAGDAGFSDLVDAQRVLLEFELAHERAAADRARAMARVRALVGVGDVDRAPGNLQTEPDDRAVRRPPGASVQDTGPKS
jgi:outer membrane protein, heavy metal efflux system